MSNIIKYNGYFALIEFDSDLKILIGRVLNTTDEITFEVESPGDVENVMAETIESHLSYCKERGIVPSKGFSGRLSFRTDPEKHKKIAITAAEAGKTVNGWLNAVADMHLA